MGNKYKMNKLYCFSAEKKEKEDKPKEVESKEPVVEEKPAPKVRSSQSKETAFMSSVVAVLEVYKTKMLVSNNHTLL